jgi:hypothetical protein
MNIWKSLFYDPVNRMVKNFSLHFIPHLVCWLDGANPSSESGKTIAVNGMLNYADLSS